MRGLIRATPAEIQDTDLGFYGTGCPHMDTECLIEQVNKLIMHYCCPSNGRPSMILSLEYMIRLSNLVVWLSISRRTLQKVSAAGHRLLAKASLKKVIQIWGTHQLRDTPIELQRVRDH